ncbi:MAG: DUF1697 domain-containing protein [Candidatus Manganitrophaceae bacterium]|nr:MAG: DUF1697 domain-containing protein [Candidatus Manganitrophaceae bacterium]
MGLYAHFCCTPPRNQRLRPKDDPHGRFEKEFRGVGIEGGAELSTKRKPGLSQPRRRCEEAGSAIKARISEDFGHDVEGLVLPSKEMIRVVDSNPFSPRLGKDEALFHATFLFQPVSESEFKKLTLPAQPGEQAALVRQVILLHCPHGYGRTKLNNNFFEKKLGVPATTRNWRTVLALQALCAEH